MLTKLETIVVRYHLELIFKQNIGPIKESDLKIEPTKTTAAKHIT